MSQVTGSTFLPTRGFRIVDVLVHTAVFAVSVKPEVVVSTGCSFTRPEVASSGPDTATPMMPIAECEGVFCFDSISMTFVHIWRVHTCIETGLLGDCYK